MGTNTLESYGTNISHVLDTLAVVYGTIYDDTSVSQTLDPCVDVNWYTLSRFEYPQ